jgi:hypothetical protein
MARRQQHDGTVRAQASRDVVLLLLLGLGVFAAFLTLQRGKLVGFDGAIMASVAHNLLLHHSVKECCNGFGVPYDPGRWSKYGIGYSLVLVPLWHFQLVTDPKGGVWLGLANPALLALSTVVLAKTGLTLGWRRSTAVLAALAFALLTMAPEYSAEFLSEPGITLAASLVLLGVALWPRNVMTGAALLGLGGMIAVLFRADSMLLVVPAAAAVFVARQWREDLSRRTWILPFGIPIGLAVVWTLYYDWLRYGKPFQFGYGGAADRLGFSTPLFSGIGLQLWSPGKSFFLYAPILIAALPGFLWLARNGVRIVVATTWLCVARILFYARWWTPIGGTFAWGPRFLMPLCAVLAVPLGATIEHIHDLKPLPRRCAIGILGALAALSAAVQIASIAVSRTDIRTDISVPIRTVKGVPKALQHGVIARRMHGYQWTFGGSHILFNLRHIRASRWSTLYWFRHGPSVFGLAMLVLAVASCAATVTVAVLADAALERSRSLAH